MNEETCRICLEPAEPDNPLFEPCRCTGSVAHVHQECLLMWFHQQKRERSCDLCGASIVFQNPLNSETHIKWHHYQTYFRHLHQKLHPSVRFSTLRPKLVKLAPSAAKRLMYTWYYIFLGGMGSVYAGNACFYLYCQVRHIVLIDGNTGSVNVDEEIPAIVVWSGLKLFLLTMLVFYVVFETSRTQFKRLQQTEKHQPEQPETQELRRKQPNAQLYADLLVDSPVRYVAGIFQLGGMAPAQIFVVFLASLLTSLWIALLALLTNISRRYTSGIDAFTAWKPQCVRKVPIDYVVIEGLLVYLLRQVLRFCKLLDHLADHLIDQSIDQSIYQSIDHSINRLVYQPIFRSLIVQTVKRTVALTAATFFIAYLHGVALFYAATGQLKFPEPYEGRVWVYLLVCAVCWCDWRTARSQMELMVRRTKHCQPPYSLENALICFLWPCVQFLPALVNHSLIVWVFSQAVPLSLRFSFSFADLRWYAVSLFSLLTPLGPKEPPLSYVALTWLRERLWMRLIAWLSPSLIVPDLVLAVRAWFLVIVLGVVPLLIGRVLGTNDLLLWVSVLAVVLPVLGLVLLRYPPKEMKHSERFQNWRKTQSIDLHSSLIPLVLVGIWYTSTNTSWTKNTLVAFLTTVWPVEWYSTLLLSLTTPFGVLRLVVVVWPWGMAVLHIVMRRTYPLKLVNYRDWSPQFQFVHLPGRSQPRWPE